MPNARLLDANSIFELRCRPERLTDEIATFIDECWQPRRAAAEAQAGARAERRPAAEA